MLNAGTFLIAGPGSADVGASETNVTFGAPMSWTNRDQLTSIDRARPFEVTWSGGTAEQGVVIAGISADTANKASGMFICLAPASAGRFVVPTSAMGNMPAAPGIAGLSKRYAMLMMTALRSGNFPTFSAPGIITGIVVPADGGGPIANYALTPMVTG